MRREGEDGSLDETAISETGLDTTAAAPAPTKRHGRGDVFGKFMVIDQLGAGAMGVVLAAYDPDLDRKVALKVLRADAGGAGDAASEGRTRLMREAQAMAKLAHPNVVTVFEVGVHEGSVFIAMELVDSGTLTSWLKVADRPRREILATFDQAGRGLAAAHAQGLVHRDFKPDNVLVGMDGRVRVSDFGLVGASGAALRGARTTSKPPTEDALSTSLTATGAVMGTPIYMAPEQHAAEPADARTDQFSFCVALYEALYGERPFSGTSYGALAEAVLKGTISAAPAGATVPEWLRAVLLRGLARDPAARFPSMDVLLEALRADPTAARRRRRISAAAAAFVVACVGVGGFALWRSKRVVVETCANFTFRWEAPVCIGNNSARPRPIWWRLSSKGGVVFRVERVNGLGEVIDSEDPAEGAIREFSYGDDGRVREVVSRNQRGEVVRQIHYTNGLSRLEIRDKDGNPQSLDGSEVSVILQDLDDRGFAVRQRHVNTYGTPRPDETGVLGYRIAYDERGLWTEQVATDGGSGPAADRLGMARTTQVFDDEGDRLEVARFAIDGKPIGNEAGNAIARTAYDAAGGRTHTYLDAGGAPAVDDGCAQRREVLDKLGLVHRTECRDRTGALVIDATGKAYAELAYDGHGDLVAYSAFDAAGKPVLERGMATTRWTHDAERRVTEIATFDTTGKAALGEDGVAVRALHYDAGDHIVEEAVFGADGAPATDPFGVATYRRTFDARGNNTEFVAFGPDGKPVLAGHGCHLTRDTYDQRSHLVERRCFGVDRAPARGNGRWSILRYEVDDLGRIRQVAYFDPAGTPTPGPEGAPMERRRYDDRGNLIERTWHAADEALMPNKRNFAVERRAYDERGNVIELSYLRADRKPTMSDDLVSTIRQTWDPQGHRTSLAYFSTDGAPMLHPKTKIAGEETRYDARGRAVEQVERDVDGAPLANADGWARRRVTFDDRGLEIERSYFGADGQPVETAQGHAVWRATYDDRRHATRIELFGRDGKPIAQADGFARIDHVFDEQGHILREQGFDVAGQPVRSHTSTFDTLGHELERRTFGPGGAPALDDDGVATWTARYDARGKVLELANVGIDGKSILSKQGFARTTGRYDDRGNRLEQSYFGADGAPVAVGRVARRLTAYDERDRPLDTSLFGVDGKPVVGTEEGYARLVEVYDARGNESERRLFGADGKPIVGKTGYATQLVVYDASDSPVDQQYLGVEGRPHGNVDGVARVTYRYDARGYLIESRHFDTTGKPGPDVPMVRYAVSPAGQVLVESYHNSDGSPFAFAGVQQMQNAFDVRGNKVETAFRSAAGALVARPDGIAIDHRTIDSRDRMIVQAFQGARGQPVAGPSGWATMYQIWSTVRPMQVERQIGVDAAGEIALGAQGLPDGHELRWRRVAGRFVKASGTDFIPGAPLVDPDHVARAQAAVAGWKTDQLRATKPELFHGARGLLVVAVTPGRLGAAAGVRPGDVVVELAGKKLDRAEAFRPIVTALAVPAPLVLIRDGASLTLELQPGLQDLWLEAQ